MATKMSVVIAKRVKAIGLKANDEDHARKLLIEMLESNGIDGMEDEDTETLIDIAESFIDERPAEEADEVEEAEAESEVETEADIIEQLADEVEEEEADEVEEEEADEVEEEEEAEGDELDSMDRKELKKFNKENELGVRVKKSMTDDDLRDEIRLAMAESATAEEEVEKPAKKPSNKDKSIKEEKGEKPKKIGKRGLKLHPKKVEEDRKHFKPLLELFPEEEFQYSWVASSGVTIKHKGENSRRAVALIESCSLLEDGNVRCHLYLLTFTKKLEILDELGLDYSTAWNDDPYIKGIHLTEAIDILKSLMPHIEEDVSKIDNRLGVNRKKMEDSLKKTAEQVAGKAKA